MKKIFWLLLALAVMPFIASMPFKTSGLFANTTYLGTPGPSGRPQGDTTTNARGQGAIEWGIGDCSTPVQAIVVSGTSTVINLSSTAKLGYAANGYSGQYFLKLVNLGVPVITCYVDNTPTSMPNTSYYGSGDVVAQNAGLVGNTFIVHAHDGVCVHLMGLTGTTTVNYSVCTN